MTRANDKQIAGTHYKTPVEPWDAILAWELGYLDGNVIKYVARWRKKGGLEDLRKAQHYLEKLIEVEAGAQTPPTTPEPPLVIFPWPHPSDNWKPVGSLPVDGEMSYAFGE